MNNISRRSFLASVSMLAAGTALTSPLTGFNSRKPLKVVLVGTGVRGISFWGKRLVEQYPEQLSFVGLCDINPGRVRFAKKYMGVDCPVYTDFDKMIAESQPDLIIVTTKDSTHHEFIINGLGKGIDVLTEKPLTTDEQKCQAILDAERKSGKKLIVGFNYRWSPYMTKVKQLLQDEVIGPITSIDFHWYLNNHHGASYFRRWHGEMKSSGSLWIHKATHHFDLVNWWLNSDPEEVFAYGALEHYGKNGPFRATNCRSCDHKKECDYFYDITSNQHEMDLYVANEEHDGYLRDGCLYRNEIDIYDKMSAQVKYANGAVLNYSLTTYSPYEGWKIAFNGRKGRIEAWLDIPWMKAEQMSQEALHAAEMGQQQESEIMVEPMIVHRNWKDYELVEVKGERAGHGGGDRRLQDKIFLDPEGEDPHNHAAGVRDGAMSMLIGVAARKSIESSRAVRIEDLIDIKPHATRMS